MADDLFEIFDPKKGKGKYMPARPVGAIVSTATFWFEIKTKEGKIVNIPCMSRSYDSETETFNPKIPDPYKKLAEKYGISPARTFWTNVIDRKGQKSPGKATKAELKEGFKDKDSDTYTPAKVWAMNATCASKTQGLMELNKRTNKKTGESKTYEPSDVRFGFDINVKHDDKAKGTAAYDVQMSEKIALTEEEQSILLWDLSKVSSLVDSLEEATRNAERLEKSMVKKATIGDEDADDDDDLEDDAPKSKKNKKSGKNQVVDEDLDDDDDEPAPKKKTGKKKPPVDDDDDDLDGDGDDLDLDDDDDEEEEKPKKKAGKVAPKKSGKKAPVDDDEDDEPAPKAGKKNKPKPVVDEDEDDDDLGDIDLDDDEPAPKAKGKAGKKTKVVDDDDDDEDEPPVKAKKNKAPVDDDDDDIDLDLDSDDDDEDEPAPKKKVAKKTKR
jgi:hypothetical protein